MLESGLLLHFGCLSHMKSPSLVVESQIFRRLPGAQPLCGGMEWFSLSLQHFWWENLWSTHGCGVIRWYYHLVMTSGPLRGAVLLKPIDICRYITIWLWLTNSLPWKDPPILNRMKNGKPSISMGHGFHGYVSHNQRGPLSRNAPSSVKSLRSRPRPSDLTEYSVSHWLMGII